MPVALKGWSSMSAEDIMCPRCGWRNPSWARMCGGCGQPLHVATPRAATPSGGGMDDPTDARAYEAPMGGATTPVYGPPPIAAAPAASLTPAWPADARAARAAGAHARRPSSPWRRALVVALVALLVLVGLGAGVWALAIRPAVHNRVDDALRSALANTIGQVPPTVPPNEYAISAATVNAHIDQNIPAGSGVSSAEIHFQNGDIVLRYTYQGSSGTVT